MDKSFVAKPKLFIGSSTEGIDLAEAVQASLYRECDVTLWTQGVFLLGMSNLENLTRIISDYDFAIIVLTPDDVVRSRGTQQKISRDNLIFELGLFMGSIGRNRAFALIDKTANLRLPSDLAGISLATYIPHESGNMQAAVGAACTQIKQAIRQVGPKQNNSPSVFQSVDSPTLFDLGTELISNAKKRVALVAKTPVLFTGPRPFGEVVQYPWEVKQFECLKYLVQAACARNGIDFRCVGSLAGLKDDLLQESHAFQENISNNLLGVFKAMSNPLSRISLHWSNDRHPMTYLVADDNYLLWFKDAGDKFCLKSQDLRIANALWQLATTNANKLEIHDIKSELGINFND